MPKVDQQSDHRFQKFFHLFLLPLVKRTVFYLIGYLRVVFFGEELGSILLFSVKYVFVVVDDVVDLQPGLVVRALVAFFQFFLHQAQGIDQK